MMMEVVVEFHAVKISYFWWSWLLHICLSVNIHDLETWLKQNIYRHTMVCIYLAIVFDRKNVSKSRSLYMQVYYHYPLFTMKRLEKKVKPFAWKLLLMPNIVLLKHSYQTFEFVRTSYKKVCLNRHDIDCFEYS